MGRDIIIFFLSFIILILIPITLIQDRNINYKKREEIVSFLIWLICIFIALSDIILFIMVMLYV